MKAAENTPNILVGEKFDFKTFSDRWLMSDVFECFVTATYGWYSHGNLYGSRFDLRNAIRIIPDNEFIEAYSGHGLAEFTLPECCIGFVDRICMAYDRVVDIKDEKPPDLWKDGKRDKAMLEKWLRNRADREYAEEDKLREILVSAKDEAVKLLKPLMGSWEFYYVELEDHNGDEQRGHDAVGEVPWYRIFSNH